MARRAIAGLLMVALAGLLWALARPAPAPAPLPVRLGIALQPGAVLLLIARDQGYFQQQGLAPTFVEYVSGKRALEEGLLQGQVDLINTGDLPLVAAGLSGAGIRALASVYSAPTGLSLVARRDRGIGGFRDLPGRRVGVQKLSAMHYFLDAALAFHETDPERVRHVYLPAEKLVPALLAGEVDAITAREPLTSQARQGLGEQARVLTAPWVYARHDLLVADPRYLAAEPEVARRVLRALVRAERFLIEQPEAATRIAAAALHAQVADLGPELADATVVVSLPQSLLVLLEGQAAWAAPRVEASGEPLRVLDLLAFDPLRGVRPEFVSVLGGVAR